MFYAQIQSVTHEFFCLLDTGERCLVIVLDVPVAVVIVGLLCIIHVQLFEGLLLAILLLLQPIHALLNLVLHDLHLQVRFLDVSG